MNILFNKKSTVDIIMKEYLEEDIEDFGEDIVSVTTSPTQKSMFIVDKRSDKLGKVKLDRLHSITEKLLYLSNRVRLDIKLTIAFICMSVPKITVQDWGKLKRVLKYLKGRIDMPIISGADSILHLMVWMGKSYAV